MTLDFLPKKYSFLSKYLDDASEIRFRQGFPITVVVNGKNKIINKNCQKEDINEIIGRVTENSIYAFNDKISKGFLTTQSGVRIGIAGECVYEKGQVLTIKDITSLCVRVPHTVDNCSKLIFNDILCEDGIYNSLIISPPSCGKTTMLKDIIAKLNFLDNKNILVIDERGEFVGVKGKNVDTIRYSDKLFAFEYGIRSMSPDIVITDELSSKRDWKFIKTAVNSGIKLVATCHGHSYRDVISKEYYIKDLFERYYLLESGKKGVLQEIRNKDGEIL